MTPEELMKKMNASVPGGVKMGSDPSLVVTFMPTGVAPIDCLLGGGLPRGRSIEVYGPPSTLKSYIAYKALAECQAEGRIAVLVDTEHSYDPGWFAALGGEPTTLVYVRTELAEEAADAMMTAVQNQAGLLVVDSIASFLPKAEHLDAKGNLKSHVDKTQLGRQAKFMSEALRRINAVNQDSALMFLNQTRKNIGVTFGDMTTTPGGEAMKFYACLAPGTLVLTADYQWVPIETLSPGDKIVGFDEEDQLYGRKMRRAEVVANEPVMLDSYEVQTSMGTTTVASADHLWLVHEGRSKWGWKRTADLTEDDTIMWFGAPWEVNNNYEEAYLSGLFDGEGSVNLSMRTRNDNYRGFGISRTQKPGVVLDKARASLSKLGFDYRESKDDRGIVRLDIRGDLVERMRFLGQVAPARLVARSQDAWDGASANRRGRFQKVEHAKVTKVEYLGKRKVYAIGTTTKTLLADGLFSHNSYRLHMTLSETQRADVKTWVEGKQKGTKETTGIVMRAFLKKSKLSKPQRDVFFKFDLTTGEIDELGYVVNMGIESGAVKTTKSGNVTVYKYGSVSGRGYNAFLAAMRKKPLVGAKLRGAMLATCEANPDLTDAS